LPRVPHLPCLPRRIAPVAPATPSPSRLIRGDGKQMRYPERLADAGIERSVGSRRDSYDNALAESIIGLFKTEVIRPKGPWRHLEAVEFATLEWVDWFNHRRLLEPLGYVPPAEYEARYYEQAAVASLTLTALRGSRYGSRRPWTHCECYPRLAHGRTSAPFRSQHSMAGAGFLNCTSRRFSQGLTNGGTE